MTDTPEIGYYIERKNDLYKQIDALETLTRSVTQTDTKIMGQGLTNLAKGQTLITELLIEILRTLEIQRAEK